MARQLLATYIYSCMHYGSDSKVHPLILWLMYLNLLGLAPMKLANCLRTLLKYGCNVKTLTVN